MPALSLDHWNVFCKDLEKTVDFYEKYVGLYSGDRPPFNFPGAWLYAGDKAILHLVSGSGRTDHGGGAIDHVAINCADIRAVKLGPLVRFRWPDVQAFLAELAAKK